MLQGSSYVRYDHKPTNSVHKKHNTLRSTLTPPVVLGRLDRGQAHTPARWKRFSLPLAKKVAKQFIEAFRDAYGGALCLSAYCREAEPGIRRAKVLASKTTSVPGGGKLRTLAMSGGVLHVKDAPFSIVRGQRGKVFSFYLYSAFTSTYDRGLCRAVLGRLGRGYAELRV